MPSRSFLASGSATTIATQPTQIRRLLMLTFTLPASSAAHGVNRDSGSYGLYLELLDGGGTMTYAQNKGVGSVTADTLKATTADLLVASKLPTRCQYFERRVFWSTTSSK
jgi:hypothetical protein